MRVAHAVIALLLALPAAARAAEYEVFIDISAEEDLYDLLIEGQLTQDSFDTLLELYQRGVELNRASREELYTLPNLTYADVDEILAYRDEVGWIADPAALVAAGVLSERKLLAIAPFLVVRDRERSPLAVDGQMRLWTAWSSADARVPPMALSTRVATLGYLTVGMSATLTRNRLGDVRYDPNREGLSAEPASAQIHLPKAYVFWRSDDLSIIAGTYRIGFGQRLTFDNTREYTPNGIYRDDELFRDTDLARSCRESQGELATSPCAGYPGSIYVTPDFRWSEGLTGVAAGLRHIPVAGGHLQAYGFLSYQPTSIYQYELYDRATCDDPQRDDDPACASPPVYRRPPEGDGNDGDGPLAPTSRYSFVTLPDMFAEMTAGGNLGFHAARRVHFGITAYASSVRWLAGVPGAGLDFQEWSRLPYGGRFGALGFDMAWGHRGLDVFFETAYSFDSMPASGKLDGGGGPAAIVRATATWKQRELEASLRYYDQDFANPHARPLAASDELDGLRARDELGFRLRYAGIEQERLNLRLAGDLWTQPSTGALKTLLYARADIDVSNRFRWGLWTELHDKDVARSGRGQCFEVAFEDDELGEPVPCAGQKIKVSGRVRYVPSPTLAVAGQLQHELLDDGRYDDRFRHDSSASLTATFKPVRQMRARAHVRYLFEDISDNGYLEHSLWSYIDLMYRLRQRDQLRFRYALRSWLDDRDRTQTRVPSPEHWMWLEYETHF